MKLKAGFSIIVSLALLISPVVASSEGAVLKVISGLPNQRSMTPLANSSRSR